MSIDDTAGLLHVGLVAGRLLHVGLVAGRLLHVGQGSAENRRPVTRIDPRSFNLSDPGDPF